MVRSWGMSEALGPLSYSKGEEQVFLGREIAQHRDYSEQTAQKIDDEISRLIKTAHGKAKSVLEEHLDLLHALSDMLLEQETVLGKELDELIIRLKPDIDLPERTENSDSEEAVMETVGAQESADNDDDGENESKENDASTSGRE
jgi:cell division protease FtsH